MAPCASPPDHLARQADEQALRQLEQEIDQWLFSYVRCWRCVDPAEYAGKVLYPMEDHEVRAFVAAHYRELWGKALLPRFKEQYAEIQARLGRRLPQGPVQDGPAPPNLFWWRGIRHELSPRQWAILHCCWGNDTMEAEELVERVWGDEGETVKDSTVRSALSQLNRRLCDIGVPWEYALRKGHVVKSCSDE